MKLDLIPAGNTAFTELIERAVQEIYGPTAVANPVVSDCTKKGQIEVVRDGVGASYAEDIERWEAVRRAACEVLATGTKPAFVRTQSGHEFHIPKEYWETKTDLERGGLWRSVVTGRLESPENQTTHGQPLYVRDYDCSAIIDKICRMTVVHPPGQAKYERWTDEVAKLRKNGMNYKEAYEKIAAREMVDSTYVGREERRVRKERGKNNLSPPNLPPLSN